MSTKELKEQIYQQVEILPDNYLERVKGYLEELNSDIIIPELGCTKEEYNRQIDEALARHMEGKSIPHEEVMRRVSERIEQYKNAR